MTNTQDEIKTMCCVYSHNMIQQVLLKLAQRKTPTRAFPNLVLNLAARVCATARPHFCTAEEARKEVVIVPQ